MIHSTDALVQPTTPPAPCACVCVGGDHGLTERRAVLCRGFWARGDSRHTYVNSREKWNANEIPCNLPGMVLSRLCSERDTFVS